MKLHFWRKDYGDSFESSDVLDVKFIGKFDIEEAAQEFAEHFWFNCDGWECSWPILFEVADEHGQHLGSVSVDNEAVPSFYAREIKP